MRYFIMEVNFIDENGNNVTKDIEFDFKNILEVGKGFKNTTQISHIPLMDFNSLTEKELSELFIKCKSSDM